MGRRPLEYLGTYDPNPKEPVVNLRRDAIEAWVAKGAQMSDTERSLVKRSGDAAPPAAQGDA